MCSSSMVAMLQKKLLRIDDELKDVMLKARVKVHPSVRAAADDVWPLFVSLQSLLLGTMPPDPHC